MLSLVGAGKKLVAVVVAPLVSPVLVSKLPLIPAVSVSPVVLSASFSSFSCLVVWSQDSFSDICVLVLPAGSFGVLEDSTPTFVYDTGSCHAVVQSSLCSKSVEGKSLWCLSSWEHVRDGGSQSRILLEELFKLNSSLSLVEERVQVDDDSSGFVSVFFPLNSSISHKYTADGPIGADFIHKPGCNIDRVNSGVHIKDFLEILYPTQEDTCFTAVSSCARGAFSISRDSSSDALDAVFKVLKLILQLGVVAVKPSDSVNCHCYPPCVGVNRLLHFCQALLNVTCQMLERSDACSLYH